MNIKETFKLGEWVYLGDEEHIVYKISKNINGLIEYGLVKKTGIYPEWYEEWQISRGKNNIGFKD